MNVVDVHQFLWLFSMTLDLFIYKMFRIIISKLNITSLFVVWHCEGKLSGQNALSGHFFADEWTNGA